MNLSTWSIRHPIPTVLLFTWLSALGLYSFHTLGITNFPDVDMPIITVSATLEGMAPVQMENEVARKIEDAVATLPLIEHIRTNVLDGVATVAVEFNTDKDAEIALAEVRNVVESIRNQLPQDLNPPVVSKRMVSGATLIAYTIESPSMDLQDISWFVDNEVSHAMMGVPGVGRFQRVGGVDREIQIDLNPVDMVALGVSTADLSAVLKSVQKESSGGRSEIEGVKRTFRTLSVSGNAAELAALVIPLAGGQTVRLSDIARITDGVAEPKSLAVLDGRPVVAFEITRSKGSKGVETALKVREAMEKFQAEHPEVIIKEAYNTFGYSYDAYVGSMQLLFEGAFLAILIVWWFLRDWRATFVAATALPLSIIPTFLLMQLFNFTLDQVTLLALALVVGVLVDDAIVEIENIMRHLRQGKSAHEAAIVAVDEIGVAVVATTLTLVAVFLPTAFIGGFSGKFLVPFGVTASVAVLASLLVARLLTPMMSAQLLRRPAHGDEGDSRLMKRYLGWIGWCLAHRKTTVGSAVGVLSLSLLLIPLLPTGFIPVADRAQVNVSLELPPGSTLADTEQVSIQAMERLRDMPEIISMYANVGTVAGAYQDLAGGDSASDIRKAAMLVTLTHRSQRKRMQVAVEDEIRHRLRDLPAVRVAIISGEPGSSLRIPLGSNDLKTLDSVVPKIMEDLHTLKGIGNVTSTVSLQRPEIHIAPYMERAADLGVTSEALLRAVRIATSGDYQMYLPKLNLPQRQVPIRMRLDSTQLPSLEAIRQMPVAARGGSVPLEAVADIRLGSGPAQIERLDRMYNISFDIELGGRQLGEVLAEAKQLPSLTHLPSGVKYLRDGDAANMEDLFSRFTVAIVCGVICIYVVLVLLFHDFLQPVTILVALPLSLGGAFGALLATHNAISLPSIFGILMLMGIVTKNSILLVDYTITARRERQIDRIAALIEACHKRARPILMTTLAMGAGMLPVALGFGADPSFRSPMAIAVIGGLITSTLLSLLVIPVVYTYVDDLKEGLLRVRLTRPD
jgi:multidrug efflux pump subunit AcrB